VWVYTGGTILIDMTLRQVLRLLIREASGFEGTGVMPIKAQQGREATGVMPPAGGEATAPFTAQQAAVARQPVKTARDRYKEQVDRVAQKVAKRLGLMEIRYVARSKRDMGAIAYAAISPNYMNVIVKIAPEHELAGYSKIEEIKQTLPPEVAKHFPVVYRLTNLKKLGVEWPKTTPYEPDINLGVIVMEQLEEIPQQIFDLIKFAPAADDFVLETFLKDPVLLNDLIEQSLISREVTQAIENFLGTAKPDYDIADIEQVKTVIKEKLMLMSNFMYPRFEPSMFQRTDLKKVSQRIKLLKPQVERLVQTALKRFDPGIELISDVVKEIANDFSETLSNQTRGIPKEPSMGQQFGVMSSSKLLTSLRNAIKYMTDHGIFVSDLHGNNFMLRPETGDIVIADLGHFELEQNLPNAGSPI
jgi:hypothetical protein